MNLLDDLKIILEKSWNSDTCVLSLRDKWNCDNPSLGQCAITSLIVNDFMGGKIMRCMCESGSHYYNLINDTIVDLTASQFDSSIPDYENGEERERKYLLSNEDTKNRYLMLLHNVKDNFILYGNNTYYLTDENNKVYPSKIPGTLGGNAILKIYGKLDCTSANRWINKGYYVDNRRFFDNEETAIKAGYRPCAKCLYKKYLKWKKEN